MHLIRTRQPSTLAPIDRSQQDAAGLVYEFAPWAGNRNLVAPQALPVVAGPAGPWSGPQGLAYGNASANSYLDTGSGWGTESATDGALVMVMYPYTPGGFEPIIGHKPAAWFLDITGSNEPRFWFGGVAAYTCSAAITVGVWQTLGVVWRSGVTNGSQFYRNGAPLGNAFTAGTLSAGSSNLFLFSRSHDEYGKLFLAGARVFTRAKTDAEMCRLTGNYWGLYRRRPRADFVPAVASAGATLTVDVGSLTLTGQSVALSRSLAVTSGSLSITGQSIALSHGLAVGSGTVTLTGQSVALAQSVAVTSGTVSLAGQSITLAQSLAVTSGALTLTGQSVALNAGASVTLAVDAGALTLTGQSVTLTASGSVTLVVDTGTLTLAGQSVTLNATSAAVPTRVQFAFARRRAVGTFACRRAGFTLARRSMTFALHG